MRTTRALARLTVAIAIVATALASGATPAAAAPDTCSGSGVLTTQSPLYAPLGGSSANGSFSGTFTIGGCVVNPGSHGNTFNGSFTSNPVGNYCGWATGQGSFAHHAFTVVSAGDTMVFSGGVVGTLKVGADATIGHSCISGATRFLFAGSLSLV